MTDALHWLFDQVTNLLLWLYESILSGFAAILNAIPVPDWATNIGSLVAGVSQDVWWWADAAELGTGLAIIAGAYGVRFLIRRIPFIG